MKTLRCLFATLLLCGAIAIQPAVLTGCKNPEQTSYRVIGATTTTVDAAMSAWGDWVRAGRATTNDRMKVKSAYETYQRAVAVAEQAVIAAKLAPTNQAPYQTALASVAAASADLIALVQSLTQKK